MSEPPARSKPLKRDAPKAKALEPKVKVRDLEALTRPLIEKRRMPREKVACSMHVTHMKATGSVASKNNR